MLSRDNEIEGWYFFPLLPCNCSLLVIICRVMFWNISFVTNYVWLEFSRMRYVYILCWPLSFPHQNILFCQSPREELCLTWFLPQWDRRRHNGLVIFPIRFLIPFIMENGIIFLRGSQKYYWKSYFLQTMVKYHNKMCNWNIILRKPKFIFSNI